MPVDDPLYGRQADPCAFERVVHMEPLKNAKELVHISHVEADSVVANGDHEPTVRIIGTLDLDLGALARPCELDGVRDQVGKGEADHGTIAIHGWQPSD